MTRTLSYRFSAALLFVAMAATSALAQAPDSADPQPGVARASLLQGSVSTQSGNSGEWDALTPNTPLFTGDSVATAPGSRAEIQLDYANIVRLSESADMRIANLSSSQVQIQLGNGLFSYSEIRPSDAAVEIDTPNVAIHPLGPGNYRIAVDASGQTQVYAWNNAADIVTPQGTTRVERGQMITIEGIDNPQYQTAATPALDGWDQWNMDRDRTIFNAQSWKDTDQYYVGTHDLDGYGRWENVPDYGNVWIPVQAAGWAPYRDGRWVWGPYYGWTWVSYEPWGWAPYHYGRWFVYRGSWCWWPGPVVGDRAYRPVWAPAYVSFVGFGSGGFSVSFGYSNIGWLPIGPADPFFPWYGRYAGRVNVISVTNIINIDRDHRRDGRWDPLGRPGMHPYSNLRDVMNDRYVRNGFTSMAANEFGRGRVPAAQRAWDAKEFNRGGMLTGGLPFSPNRASYRATDQAVNPRAVPSRNIQNERFFADQHTSRPAPRAGNEPAHQSPQPAWRNFGEGGAASGAPARMPVRPQQPEANGRTGAGTAARPGWNSFRAADRPSAAAERPASPAAPGPQSTFSAPRQPASPQPERGRGWQPFVQQNSQRQLDSGRGSAGRPGTYGFAPDRSSAGTNGASQNPAEGRGSDRSNRPPLDLRQPVVRPRQSGGAASGRSGAERGGRGENGGGNGRSRSEGRGGNRGR